MDFKKHCKVVSGLYVKDHDNPTIKISKNTRNHKCIDL